MSTMVPLLISVIITNLVFLVNGDVGVGVCYGQIGDNLPPPPNVIGLYKSHNINKMRIFQPDPAVLEALRGSGIQVTVGTLNSDVPLIAQSPAVAQTWFGAHIQPYIGSVKITYITLGNEVYPSQPSSFILPAMQNLQSVIDAAGLHGVIKVSTVVSMEVLQNSYPPSNTTFLDPSMAGIVRFLQTQGSELHVNVYPYFVYASNAGEVRLDYAQFTATGVVVQDGPLGYSNLFDAMVDTFYWANQKVGASDLGLVISETGWPHGGGDISTTTLNNAANYNTKLVQHLKSGAGTPKRPNVYLQGYIFAMFDEDLKGPGVERFWGLFQPSGQPNYNIFS